MTTNYWLEGLQIAESEAEKSGASNYIDLHLSLAPTLNLCRKFADYYKDDTTKQLQFLETENGILSYLDNVAMQQAKHDDYLPKTIPPLHIAADD